MNLLNPNNAISAGILHRNSTIVAQRGPWRFVGVTWGDAVDGSSDGEPTRPEHIVRGGTCEVCGAAIINIVDMLNANGERITVGVDCSETLLTNQSKLRLKNALKVHAKQLRDARNAKKQDELNEIMADPAKIEALKSKSHPMTYRAEKGETLLDWALFMAKASGAAGRAKALKTIKAALE